MKNLLQLAFTIWVFASRLFAVDTNAPVITSASLSTNSVDISSGPVPITITLQITDDDSGFDFGNVYLHCESVGFVKAEYFGTEQRTLGDAMNGTYVVTMQVPQYAAAGNWRVDALVDDVAKNRHNYGPHPIDNIPFPNPAAMAISVVNNGDLDDDAPSMTSISIPPGPLNVGSSAATVTITIECGDTLSGFDYGFIQLKDPADQQRYDLWTSFSDFDRVSGNANSGIYEVDVTLPLGSDVGTWTFEVFLQDKVGRNSLSAGGNLIVTASATPNSFLAHAVDAVQHSFTTSGSGWIMQSIDSNDGIDAAMSLPIADEGQCSFQTTVTGPGTLSFHWRVDSEQDQDSLSVSVGGAVENEISGNTAWQPVSLAIPAGAQTIVWRYAKDAGGSNGDDRGWVDEVRFEADSDLALPVLQALRISPRSVDLLAGPQNVDFTIEVTDDFNGLLEGRLKLFDPSGNEIMSTTFDTPNSGNSLAGTYELTLEIDDTVEFGMWRAEVELTEATTNSTRLYGPAGDPFPAKAIESFHVGNSSANDSSPPLVRAIAVTPGIVDISAGPTTTTVTVHVTDAIAGLSHADLAVYNPDQNWTGGFHFDSANRISGDEFNGIYQLEITIPQYGKPGTWELGCTVRDDNGNSQEYTYDLEFPADVDETFAVTNSGQIDQTTPVVTSIDINPEQVDTGSGPAQVGVTVTIQDDLSGMHQAFLYFYSPGDQFEGSMISVLNNSNLISGDSMTGTYHISQTLPQGSPAGDWLVRIFIRDVTGNAVLYGQDFTAFPEPGDGTFTVQGAELPLFDAFMDTHSLTGNDALPGADPDGDGKNNATELLLGTNPAIADGTAANLITVSRDATHLHLDFTIDPTLTVTPNGNFLDLDDGGGGAPFKLTGQTQNSLSGPWTDTLPVLISGSTYRVSIALASGAKGFARLHFLSP